MSAIGNKRRIAALLLPDALPADVELSVRPRFAEADPSKLFVDETYQRNLSDRSLRLIRRIVEHWDWRRYKAPIVVDVAGEFHVIDGQHTAIAAVTHGGLPAIPVMIVEAGGVSDRAKAFVGHNRDRIGITPQQIFFAELAAGDDDAQTIAQVCERAGVKILKYPPQRGVFKTGETMAIATIRQLVSKHGAMGARQVLQPIVEAGCAPIGADMMKAVAELLFAPEFRGTFKSERLRDVIRSVGNEMPKETIQLHHAKKIPIWRALVVTLSNRRARRGLSAAA